MNATSKINKIRTLLGLDVVLETKKLENGTTFESESFEAGSDVFILTEDEKIPVPVGTYSMEDGVELTVEKEGVIASLGKKDEDEYEKEVSEDKEEEKEDMNEEKYPTREEFETLKTMVEELKGKLEAETEEEEADDAKEKVEEEKEELSAVQPFKHNPEKQNNRQSHNKKIFSKSIKKKRRQ